MKLSKLFPAILVAGCSLGHLSTTSVAATWLQEADATTQEATEITSKTVGDLITANELDKAAAALESAAAKDPSTKWLASRRSLLASEFIRKGSYDDALKLLQQNYQHFADNPTLAGSFAMRYSAAMQIDSLARRTGQPELGPPLMADLTAALKIDQDSSDKINSNTTLYMNVLSANARNLSAEAAAESIQAEFNRVEKLYLADAENNLATAAYVNAMQTMAFPVYTGGKPNDDMVAKLVSFVTLDLENNLGSTQSASSYASTMSRIASISLREKPADAKIMVDQAIELLEKSKAEMTQSGEADVKSVENGMRSLQSLKPRIESALKLTQLIGQPAPVFDAAAWVNGDAVTLDDLKGKVVLLDFWAVWCGPCIATFPHLKEWNEDYGEKGLVILGVTSQYNYTWDDEATRASRSKEDISMEDELVMLEKFLAHHELKHRSMVNPKLSEMKPGYGVSGIPQAVLIDKAGKVRMIKVGSGQANADALHEMIETLLDE